MSSDLRLYHDSDGCFADFSNHSRDLLGVHPTTVGDEKFWQIANQHSDFWRTMPLISGAEAYWDRIKHLKPIILTGAPKGDFDRARDHKLEWWQKNFAHSDVIVCLSRNKHTYASPTTVLVDDTHRMVKGFQKAGGIGILHLAFESSLVDLRQAGFDIP